MPRRRWPSCWTGCARSGSGLALQHPHRGRLRQLDQAIHPLPRQASSAGNGGGRDRGVSHPPGRRAEGRRQHPEPGLLRHPVPVPEVSSGAPRPAPAPHVLWAPPARTGSRSSSLGGRGPPRPRRVRRNTPGSWPTSCTGPASDSSSACRLRVKDVDFDRRPDHRPGSQGGQGPGRPAPGRVGRCPAPPRQVDHVRTLHARDLARRPRPGLACRTPWPRSTRPPTANSAGNTCSHPPGPQHRPPLPGRPPPPPPCPPSPALQKHVPGRGPRGRFADQARELPHAPDIPSRPTCSRTDTIFAPCKSC